MNRSGSSHAGGFTFVEVLIVMAIISVLISFAIPNFMTQRQKAKEAACLSNRRNIETDEAGYFAQNQEVSLSIADTYQCPSGGTYVWLVSDPQDPGYPQVGCSIHFIGSDALQDPATETPVGTDSPAPETPDGTTDPVTEPPAGTADPATETPAGTPDLAMDDLTEFILGLSLTSKTEDKLIKIMERAMAQFEKGQIDQADKSLSAFQKEVDKESKEIDDETESVLKQKATEIQEILKQLP